MPQDSVLSTTKHLRRIKVIACEIFHREICLCAANSTCHLDLEFLPKGLHDLPTAEMRSRIQETIDRVPADRYEAIALAFALCNNGIAGIEARSLPVAITRAHDCITLFLGSRKRYTDIFEQNPGTYFITTGWCERGGVSTELRRQTVLSSMGIDKTYQEYVQTYGKENAEFIMRFTGDYLRNYSRYLFISLGLGGEEYWETAAREDAEKKGWSFRSVRGDLRLLRMLCNGEWPEDEFLVLKPGERVTATHDGTIIAAEGG